MTPWRHALEDLRREVQHRSRDTRRENDDRDRLLVQIMDERRDHADQRFNDHVTATQEAALRSDAAISHRLDALTERLDALAIRITRSEGKGAGLNAGWAYLLGFAALLGVALSVVLALNGDG